MDYEAQYEQARQMAEQALKESLLDMGPHQELLQAMRYSLLAGGKRIRPVLVLKFCEALCGSMEPAVDYAECTAVLAGDALQAEAFSRLATSRRTQRVESNGEACAVLAQAAGAIQGICAGQYLDMNGENQTEERLNLVHSWKTAALLKAACLLGLTASPVAPTMAQWKAAKEYAQGLGVAFQIRDDMLDEESTTQQLGKPVGSDRENGKVTYVTLYGLDSCRELVQRYTHRAKLAVQEAFPDSCEFLCALADALAKRDH